MITQLLIRRTFVTLHMVHPCHLPDNLLQSIASAQSVIAPSFSFCSEPANR